MNYHGPSGDVTHVSGLCTLPINIVNEKIYLIIWIWYITMIILTVISLLAQILVLLAPYLRQVFLQREVKQVPPTLMRRLIRHSSYGDYILLTILAKNLDTTQFSALISHLCDNISLVSPRAQVEYFLLRTETYSPPFLKKVRRLVGSCYELETKPVLQYNDNGIMSFIFRLILLWIPPIILQINITEIV